MGFDQPSTRIASAGCSTGRRRRRDKQVRLWVEPPPPSPWQPAVSRIRPSGRGLELLFGPGLLVVHRPEEVARALPAAEVSQALEAQAKGSPAESWWVGLGGLLRGQPNLLSPVGQPPGVTPPRLLPLFNYASGKADRHPTHRNRRPCRLLLASRPPWRGPCCRSWPRPPRDRPPRLGCPCSAQSGSSPRRPRHTTSFRSALTRLDTSELGPVVQGLAASPPRTTPS